MPSLTSEQVNYLILKYFQEEGLSLSAYALAKETSIGDDNAKTPDEKLDAGLVQLLLKGIQLTEIESSEHNQVVEPIKIEAGSEEKHEESRGSKLVVKKLEHVCDLSGGVIVAYVSPTCFVIGGPTEISGWTSVSQEPIKLDRYENPTCIEPLGSLSATSDNVVLIGTANGGVRQYKFNATEVALQSVLIPDAQVGPVFLIRASPSGGLAAVVDAKWGNVFVWDLSSRSLIATLNISLIELDPTVLDVAWIGGDSTLGVAHASGIAVFQIGSDATPESASLQPKTWLKSHKRPVNSLAFDPVAQLLASGGDDGAVCVWNAQSPDPIRRFGVSSLESPISHVSWLGIYLLTSTTDGIISLWDTRPLEAEKLCSIDVGEPILGLEVSKHIPAHCAIITPYSVHVYVLNFNPNSLKFVGKVEGKNIQSISWSLDQSLAVCSTDSSVIIRIN